MIESSGKEVSCRAFDSPLAALDYLGVPAEKALEGFPFDLKYVRNSRNSVSWDQFVDFVDRVCVAAGGIEKLYEADAAIFKDKNTAAYLSLACHFTRPQAFYWMLCRWLAPMLMRNIKYEYKEIGPGRIEINMVLNEGYRGSLPIFLLWKRGLEIFPMNLGLDRSLVEAEVTPYGLAARVTPAPSFTLLTRLQQAWRALFNSKSALTILAEQASDLRIHYDELLDSRQKIMEQEVKLKLSSQMAALTKLSALGEMAAGVAHEINNPLAIIIGHSQVIRHRKSRGELTPEQLEESLGKIEMTALRIAEIVRGLRVFSRDAGRDPFADAEVSDILRDTYALCGERFKNQGVRLETEGDTSGIRIECRSVQLSQVLLNLLSNSLDSVRESSDPWVKVMIKDLGGMLEISIVDSGKGVSSDHRDKLFQPFFTTKPVGAGTGLGLSVSRGLIEAHSGRLEFDEMSLHTRFVITVPKRQVKLK